MILKKAKTMIKSNCDIPNNAQRRSVAQIIPFNSQKKTRNNLLQIIKSYPHH